jgi:hypothetical protein
VKPEIINIPLEFVADFCVLKKKNVLKGTLRKNVEFFNGALAKPKSFDHQGH